MDRITVEITSKAGRQTCTFDALPIRVGRSTHCECQIDSEFVSRDHAMIDLIGDELVVLDLGSMNGLVVDGHPIGRGESARLTTGRFEIVHGDDCLQISVERRDASEGATEAPPTPQNVTALYAEKNFDEGRANAECVRALLHESLEEYRASAEKLFEGLAKAVSLLKDPASREALLREVAIYAPAIAHEQRFIRVVQECGVDLRDLPLVARVIEADTALAGLNAFACGYRNANFLEGASAITSFLTRLEQSFRLACDGLALLLYAHELDENRPAMDNGELAARLLNDEDEVSILELRVLDAFRRRHEQGARHAREVDEILRELSPARAEAALDVRSKLGRLLRASSLWRFFEARHGCVSGRFRGAALNESVAGVVDPREPDRPSARPTPWGAPHALALAGT